MANVQLAKNLKILRKKHNYTQQDLSDILNITRHAYSHYEQALREPDLNALVHLSHLYKVSLDELIAGNIHPDEVRESMPVYKYRLGETSDHKWSICLTEQDLNLLEKFRNASENTQQVILEFLDKS